jgi:hypothetical protein
MFSFHASSTQEFSIAMERRTQESFAVVVLSVLELSQNPCIVLMVHL